MKTALFISPHLDDVAFSCGGTLIKLAQEGWRTILCTVFTASVDNPQGFALACQLDKGLPPEVDYMTLRREEDFAFATTAGVDSVLHLNFPEAPHRGYNSASELFNGINENDRIWLDVTAKLGEIIENVSPQIIFAPQGIGSHVDHLQTIKATSICGFQHPIYWYEDTPYIIRNPQAPASSLLPTNLHQKKIDITTQIEQKISACLSYQTQITFQFGSEPNLAVMLTRFHKNVSKLKQINLSYSETFLQQD